MGSFSVNEFQSQRLSLIEGPLSGAKEFLLEIGTYFHETLGSDVDEFVVVQTEHYLNTLYLVTEGNDIQETITDALGLASHLCRMIKIESRDGDFYANIKKLGQALILISGNI